MGLHGPLGQLQRGVSDVVSEVEVINEDEARQRWTATSAELWPVRLPVSVASSLLFACPRVLLTIQVLHCAAATLALRTFLTVPYDS
jgi:hypothetical protein